MWPKPEKKSAIGEKRREGRRIVRCVLVEYVEVAEIEWKGITWRAAYGDLDVRGLLTVLKGFGPMEILDFERSGHFRGQLSMFREEGGLRGITIYHLEVFGPGRMGQGRAALQFLRDIFKGEIYVEDPGGEVIRVAGADEESLPFWVKMFREGLIDALDCTSCSLQKGMNASEVDRIAVEISKSRETGALRGAENESEG